MTHRAEWTPLMYQKINGAKTKQDRLALLRRYGWGVPSEENLLNSSYNSATIVSKSEFRPFDDKDYTQKEFQLHTLPWPKSVLENLENETVRLRVTLSYFIEPSASRRGWRQRYTYPSHSLRFDLQNRSESLETFIHRINGNSEKLSRTSSSQSKRWLAPTNVMSNHCIKMNGQDLQLIWLNAIP